MAQAEPVERQDGRIRMTVLGGFLGSGKTTWLRHQLHEGRFRDALVLVNEAAEVPVDDALLSRSARLETLAGCCACCDGREAFAALLREICDRRIRDPLGAGAFDRIVLETSGVADPGPIVETIRADPVLTHHLVVHEIVVAVDGLNGLGQLRSEPLGRRQVEAADRLVLTKLDAAQPGAVARLAATLRSLNPGAAIGGSIMGGDAGLPSDEGIAPEPIASGADVAPIAATRLRLDGDVDWNAFAIWLSALLHARGDDVMRVKGVVRTPAGRLLLQSVRRVVQAPEMLPEDERIGGDADDSVVFIGRGFEGEQLRRSLRRFAAA